MRDTRLLISSVGISALGDMLLGIPLALQVQALTGSSLAVSAFFLALWGPSVVLAGAAGLAVDRWENTRLLAVMSVLQAVAACGLLAAGSLPSILALTALLGSGAAVAQAAEFALLPAVAGEEHVARANGQVEAARYLGMTAGPALGGVLAAAGLLDVAIAVDAASFAVVAVVALSLRARRAPNPAGRERARAGAAVLLADRTLAVTLAAAVAALAFFTISATAEVFFATDVLGAGGTGWGLMLTAWTVGMVAGAVGFARRVPRGRLATGALAAVAVQGLGIAGASAACVLWVAMAGCAVGGLGHGVKNVLLRTLIHEHVPDAVRGRAFAAYNAARNAAELGALAAGGVLVALVGARAALAIAGLVPLAIGLLALFTRPARGSTTRRTAYAHVPRLTCPPPTPAARSTSSRRCGREWCASSARAWASPRSAPTSWISRRTTSRRATTSRTPDSRSSTSRCAVPARWPSARRACRSTPSTWSASTPASTARWRAGPRACACCASAA